MTGTRILAFAWWFFCGLGAGLLVPRATATPTKAAGDVEILYDRGVLELPPGLEEVTVRTALKALRTADPEGSQLHPMARELLLLGAREDTLSMRVRVGSTISDSLNWDLTSPKPRKLRFDFRLELKSGKAAGAL